MNINRSTYVVVLNMESDEEKSNKSERSRIAASKKRAGVKRKKDGERPKFELIGVFRPETDTSPRPDRWLVNRCKKIATDVNASCAVMMGWNAELLTNLLLRNEKVIVVDEDTDGSVRRQIETAFLDDSNRIAFVPTTFSENVIAVMKTKRDLPFKIYEAKAYEYYRFA